ncbi:P-loop containing nucleoside triphosphate hydrolase protein [Thozetella sp. PMI_491]|nr:P-loop containing nucleoside triphosphate hydrolase protein [Thozetella sp. PMI_491]
MRVYTSDPCPTAIYAPQQDILVPQLTVRENFWNSARIRLPSLWTDEECEAYIDELISLLGLVSVQDSVISYPSSSLKSGGQRKRVSIGIELAAAPIVLFLDEPTSGLDATIALTTVMILKALSQQGVTIICIIHQPRPEILDLLDGIHLLSDGYQVYHGKTSEMATHFESLGFDWVCD